MLTIALALLFQLPFVPPPEVTLIRSSMAPLARVLPDGTLAPFGPLSPRGFGRDTGRLRYLAASTTIGVVVAEVADAIGGALYAIPGDGRVPLRLVSTTSLGLDVALSPDGRRLLYVDGDSPCIVALAAPVTPAVCIAPSSPAPANVPDIRIDRPRWLDDQTIAYERETTHRPGNLITTTIEAAPADGSEPAHLLVPRSPTQDRLAAVVGDVVLAYREGTLFRFMNGAVEPIGGHFGAGVAGVAHGVAGDRAIVTLGESGTPVALATIDRHGTRSPLAPERTLYGDPLISPDGHDVLYAASTGSGWVVRAIAIDGSSDRALTPPTRDPTELVTFVPGTSLIAGCRGDAVVLVDSAHVATPRVLTHAPANPSCTIRGATPTRIAVERKLGETWRVELLPTIEGDATIIARGDFGSDPSLSIPASVAGLLGDTVIVQTGWEGVATIVASALGRVTTLVPWQLGGIRDAVRTPDGKTVVFRAQPTDPWRAVRLDRANVIVEITARDAGLAIGLSDDHLVGWDQAGSRFVAWRLDGSDAARPRTLLDGVLVPAPFAAPDRVIGQRADGSVLSAPIDGSAPPVVVMRCGFTSRLDYDAAHRRVVAACMHESSLTILSADVLGADAGHPRVLGQPRPPADTNLDAVDVLPSGDVFLGYATRYTAAPHPAGMNVLASNGSGFRPPPALSATAPLARPWRRQAYSLSTTPRSDDPSGAETRTPLR